MTEDAVKKVKTLVTSYQAILESRAAPGSVFVVSDGCSRSMSGGEADDRANQPRATLLYADWVFQNKLAEIPNS